MEYKRASSANQPDENLLTLYFNGGWEFIQTVYDCDNHLWFTYFRRKFTVISMSGVGQ